MITPLVVGYPTRFAQELSWALRRAGFRQDSVRSEHLDRTDPDACRRLILETQADVVIDCGATFDFGQRRPSIAYDALVSGAVNVARAAAERSAHTVFVSSADVFENSGGASCVESDRPTPVTRTARTSLTAEHLVAASSLRYTILRTTGLYGHPWPAAFEAIRQRAERDRTLVVSPAPIRTPTYAAQLAAIVVELLRRPSYGVFHRSASGECTELELTQALVALASVDCRIERDATPGAEQRRAPGNMGSRRDELPPLPHWRIGLRALAIDRQAGRHVRLAPGPFT